MRESNNAIFGEDVLSRTEPDWGLDDEGEINGVYRDGDVPGLYIMMGESLLFARDTAG